MHHKHDDATRILTTDDVLLSLCNSVTKVLTSAAHNNIRFSGMVQRIKKAGLKPDIGSFVLFDGGFSGLVVINFSAAAAMELYQDYMKSMGFPQEELAISYTSDEVGNVMGELMNQIVGRFSKKVGRDLQTHISQSQPKMLALNMPIFLSIDTNLDNPEMRRVTFFTEKNNIFYMELAMDRTEFIKIHDGVMLEEVDPDELIAQAREKRSEQGAVAVPAESGEHDALLSSLGI